MDPAKRLREQAARARYYARAAAMADDRAAWLAIAERWEKLAEEANKPASKEPGD
jgi:hypothetical protein